MENQFEREIRLIEEQGLEKLKSSKVIVFGVAERRVGYCCARPA